VEQHNIRDKRLQYLREIKEYREEGRLITYMGETYIHSSHTTPHALSDGSIQGLFFLVSKANSSLLSMEGISKFSFLTPMAASNPNKKTGDYRSYMNYTNYEK
jgi:hypothetical protein